MNFLLYAPPETPFWDNFTELVMREIKASGVELHKVRHACWFGVPLKGFVVRCSVCELISTVHCAHTLFNSSPAYSSPTRVSRYKQSLDTGIVGVLQILWLQRKYNGHSVPVPGGVTVLERYAISVEEILRRNASGVNIDLTLQLTAEQAQYVPAISSTLHPDLAP